MHMCVSVFVHASLCPCESAQTGTWWWCSGTPLRSPAVASQWISVYLCLSLTGIVLGTLPAPCALVSYHGVVCPITSTSLRVEVPWTDEQILSQQGSSLHWGCSLWEECSEQQGVWLGLSGVRFFGYVHTQSDMFCFRENEVEVWACNFPLLLILGESKQLCLKIGHGDCRDPSEEELFGLSGRQLSLQPACGLVWLLCMYVYMHACSTWNSWLTRQSTYDINRDKSH